MRLGRQSRQRQDRHSVYRGTLLWVLKGWLAVMLRAAVVLWLWRMFGCMVVSVFVFVGCVAVLTVRIDTVILERRPLCVDCIGRVRPGSLVRQKSLTPVAIPRLAAPESWLLTNSSLSANTPNTQPTPTHPCIRRTRAATTSPIHWRQRTHLQVTTLPRTARCPRYSIDPAT
jgi:hypothetical protein